ncbi:unnamed protein product [Mytilus coruscus]|uniref:Reverse transcriptase domain-containing protein n=1 Tax=Mytilus coruscus TaxID=42192 RepID=A0A6J8DJW6_MYTCO|nr:unnamed protein product [Mytilus coruscus]
MHTGAINPLMIKSKIRSDITCEESRKCVKADFMVIDGNHTPLLGRSTACELGILLIGPSVNMINTKGDIVSKYSDLFCGLGKLKDYQLKIYIDKNVKPIAQPTRRLPFNIRKSVEEKLCELEEMDVIERVEGPTEWVSPLVVVPKRNSEIRICVDMRRANEAVKRSRHPIPTVDEILQELNGAKVYSKIDLRMGFHQVELEPESRNITTFTTHVGLFRYKRLMFGISCAPEMYQQCIKMALEGCAGQRNISDDIIVYGCTQQEHDERLNKVLDRMREKGLRLNKDKSRIERWAMRLQPYTFKVKYKPGPQNAADCLSRLSQVQDETTGRNIAEEYAYFVAQNAVPNAMTFKMIKDSANLDKDIKQILNGKFQSQTISFVSRRIISC